MTTAYVVTYETQGSRNSFYRVGGRKNIGFKEFETKDSALFSHKVQRILSEDDMAPRVYSEVGRARFSSGSLTMYGYLTEIARPMRICRDTYCDGQCFYATSECENSQMISSVVYHLESFGIDYNDAHAANFGFIHRNKQRILVPIDFGVESFSDWRYDIYGSFDYEKYNKETST